MRKKSAPGDDSGTLSTLGYIAAMETQLNALLPAGFTFLGYLLEMAVTEADDAVERVRSHKSQKSVAAGQVSGKALMNVTQWKEMPGWELGFDKDGMHIPGRLRPTRKSPSIE